MGVDPQRHAGLQAQGAGQEDVLLSRGPEPTAWPAGSGRSQPGGAPCRAGARSPPTGARRARRDAPRGRCTPAEGGARRPFSCPGRSRRRRTGPKRRQPHAEECMMRVASMRPGGPFLAGFACSLLAAPIRAAGPPAFPGAEGFGAATPGGRGGRVASFELRGLRPRQLSRGRRGAGPAHGGVPGRRADHPAHKVEITEPFLTVAGQTAPGDGVCFRGRRSRSGRTTSSCATSGSGPGTSPERQWTASTSAAARAA